MYTTCMFCRKPLGANEVVESFPVGRRLAFDSARGRLWVVCTKCERWNLTPLEERWEAVEDCERIFGDTRIRVSTDNIGLARHPEGLTLVRIGEPMRPEFAAWRYGDQFGRRRKRQILYGAGAAVVVGGVVGRGHSHRPPEAASHSARAADLRNLGTNHRTLVGNMQPEDGKGDQTQTRRTCWATRLRSLRHRRLRRIQIRTGPEEDLVPAGRSRQTASPAAIRRGPNASGAKKDTVQRAVQKIEWVGHPESFLADIAQRDSYQDKKGVPGYINKMPTTTKLALEMALHEEQERRALEGELWLLERAWEEAEEIAEISDNLLLPESTDEFLRRHREEQSAPANADSGPGRQLPG